MTQETKEVPSKRLKNSYRKIYSTKDGDGQRVWKEGRPSFKSWVHDIQKQSGMWGILPTWRRWAQQWLDNKEASNSRR